MQIICFMVFFITLIMFFVYWWKKRKARLAAGENYQNDESYQNITAQKRVIGLICVLSFIGIPLTTPEMTLEEKAAYQAKVEQAAAERKAQEEAEAKRLAEEKAAKEAEEKRLAEEKAAKEAEEKRLAEEKATKEAEEKRLAAERKYVGTYNSGMKAYIVPGSLKVSNNGCNVKIAAEDDAGNVSYLDYRLWREGGALHFENSEGFSGTVTPNMTVENGIWEVAQSEGKISSDKESKSEGSGIWDSVKSYASDKLNDAKEFAGGVVSNEVHVCDGKLGAYYFIPSTKKRRDYGLIFKDEGYEIEVISKIPSGEILISNIYWFREDGDDVVFSVNDGKDWYRVKERYSGLEEAFDLQVGAKVYDASKRFPNLGVKK